MKRGAGDLRAWVSFTFRVHGSSEPGGWNLVAAAESVWAGWAEVRLGRGERPLTSPSARRVPGSPLPSPG